MVGFLTISVMGTPVSWPTASDASTSTWYKRTRKCLGSHEDRRPLRWLNSQPR